MGLGCKRGIFKEWNGMKRHAWFSAFVLASVSSMALAIEEDFCTVPTSCTDDVLSIRFTANDTSALNVAVGDTISAYVALDVKTHFTGVENCSQGKRGDATDPPIPPISDCTHVEGFSYGVKHDIAVLEILTARARKADGVSPLMTANICKDADWPCDPPGGIEF